MKAKRIIFVAFVICFAALRITVRTAVLKQRYQPVRTIDYTVEYRDLLDHALGTWRVVERRYSYSKDINREPGEPAQKKLYRHWKLAYTDYNGERQTVEIDNRVSYLIWDSDEEWIHNKLYYQMQDQLYDWLRDALYDPDDYFTSPSIYLVYPDEYWEDAACHDAVREHWLQTTRLYEHPVAMLQREDICVEFELERDGFDRYEDVLAAVKQRRTELGELAGAPVNLYISIYKARPNDGEATDFLYAGEADLGESVADSYGFPEKPRRRLGEHYQYSWLDVPQ